MSLSVGFDGCGISLPTGIRSPDSPARSQSLYRLSSPGPHTENQAFSIRTVKRNNEYISYHVAAASFCIPWYITRQNQLGYTIAVK